MKIGVMGGGHVASHLISALSKIADELICYNRTKKKLVSITKGLKPNNITILNNPNFLKYDIDFLIIMVSDDVITDNVKNVKTKKNTVLLHTSGGHSINILAPYSNFYGALYPLQTFTTKVHLDIQSIPFIVQGSDDNVTKKIELLARKLSNHVYHLDDEQKKTLHVSAAFACNFVNHCWLYASELLEDKNIPFDIIKPLISQTVEKAFQQLPKNSQTGPAVRGDITTIEQHKKILENKIKKNAKKNDVLKVYNAMTKDIINYYSS